ncbi:MAG: hypothetical protein IH586_20305, partial [Anaerolineaceae bacterium]|nr:hypothetical protein [Anaerolineaceae bacterium]
MIASAIRDEFDRGEGILRLLPAFVTMGFNQAGGRLRLHPDDWYPKGTRAGSVKERWLSSVLAPRQGNDEGLSYVHLGLIGDERCPLPEAIELLGADLIGEEYLQLYGTWPIHAKFFDYHQPLFLHLHLDEISAARIGARGKPEAYFFPVQMNNHPGVFPVTFFGVSPEITREEFLNRLQNWEKRDTNITGLSRAYRLETGTGWYTPPGVLHAPGSLLTYEVQWNSASGAVYENILTTSGEFYGIGSLTGSCPPDHKEDWEYILNLIDWPVNLDTSYREHYYRPGIGIPSLSAGCQERWIVYGNPYFSAKELVVLPREKVFVADPQAYG